jgi:hypothetical protein
MACKWLILNGGDDPDIRRDDLSNAMYSQACLVFYPMTDSA